MYMHASSRHSRAARAQVRIGVICRTSSPCSAGVAFVSGEAEAPGGSGTSGNSSGYCGM
jgi:hypothetical protein